MNETSRVRERGAALIEFALVLPIVVCVTFMVIDFGRAFYVKNVVEQISREGARQLAVGRTVDEVRANIKALANQAGLDSSQTNVDPKDNYSVDQVRCQVTQTFTWIFPGVVQYFVPGKSPTDNLIGAVVMRREG